MNAVRMTGATEWKSFLKLIVTWRRRGEAIFSKEQVGRVASLGTQLAQKAGGFAKAGIQLRELRMRSLATGRKTIEEYSYLYPAISDQVVEISAKGEPFDAAAEGTDRRGRYLTASTLNGEHNFETPLG